MRRRVFQVNSFSLPTIPEEDEPDNQDVEEVGEEHSEIEAQQQEIGIDLNFLGENGFYVIEYINRGKFGEVYSANANERAQRIQPIDRMPEEGVIGQNVWQLGAQSYELRSMEGYKVAIKYIPPAEHQPWDDSDSEVDLEPDDMGAIGGIDALFSAVSLTDSKDRFNEIRKLIELSHQNIVDVYNVLEDQRKAIYIIMEFLDMNLKEWVEAMDESAKRLDDRQVEAFLRQLIDGLAYLHSHHIYHNDLHAGNVMMTLNDRGFLTIKYVDLGQAEYFSEYNSPEGDIKGLGRLIRLVMTLLDSNNPEFRSELETFAYTALKGYYSDINEVIKQFEDLRRLLIGSPIVEQRKRRSSSGN